MSSRLLNRIASDQSAILKSIATGVPLPHILSDVARFVEVDGQGIRCGIYVFDRSGSQVALSVGPNLPAGYCSKQVGTPLGAPCLAPCAMVAKQRKEIVSYDIANDDRWPAKPWRELALQHGLRSCRSTPVVGSDGTVCASFALYSKNINSEELLDVALVDGAINLASIAIERENREADSRENEERFRIMVDSTPVLVWMADLTKGCNYFNKRWLEFTGKSLEAESGHGWLDGVHPDDIKRCGAIYSDAFDRREDFQVEYRLRRHDGQFRWLLNCGNPLLTPDGRFLGFIGGCVDIHEKKELETRLRDSEARTRLAIEATGMGFWEWSIDGSMKWSPEHNRLFGIDPLIENGSYDILIEFVHPDDRSLVQVAVEKAISNQGDFVAEYRIFGPDREIRWISAHGRPHVDEASGQVVRMPGVVRDVTDRRQSEDQLRKNAIELRSALDAAEIAREHSEAASRTKDQFLAVLSHELRTPLTPVLMAVSLLRMDRSLTQSTRDSLDMIQRNVKLESRLIDNLLDLTRVVRNKLEIHTEPMDLHDAVRGALDISGPEIQSNQMELRVDLAANLSKVYGDATRLQQVFWNLVQNAVKFTPLGGSLTITSRNVGCIVRVDLCDSGVGINPVLLHRIFDAFGADARELPRPGGGVGLGLMVAKAVVDAHGGRLVASSDGVGKGTQLSVELATIAE